MDRYEIIEIAINKFRGGTSGDLANWIDMALDLYGDRPLDAKPQNQQAGDNMAGYKQAINTKLSSGLVAQNGGPQSVQGLIPNGIIDDHCRLGAKQKWVNEDGSTFETYGPIGLSGAAVLGSNDSMGQQEETIDDIYNRMTENLPKSLDIVPDGRPPMSCEVIVTKNESSIPGGRQPCVGVRFQWDTGDSKEAVCDNFLFPGKVQTPESVLEEMVNRVKILYKRRSSPIMAKAPTLDKTPIMAS